MSTTLTKKAYTSLIEENISELERYMPEHSLEKKHTIDVLRDSIRFYYPEKCHHEWVSSVAYKGAQVCSKCQTYR